MSHALLGSHFILRLSFMEPGRDLKGHSAGCTFQMTKQTSREGEWYLAMVIHW
jgi:hypothetical protein